MEDRKSALGLNENITAFVAYIVGIVALALIFIEKDSKFVRFHAFQSVLYWAIALVAYFVLIFVMAFVSFFSGTLASVISLLVFLFGLAVTGCVIFLAVKALQGSTIKLPIIGEMAEKWSK